MREKEQRWQWLPHWGTSTWWGMGEQRVPSHPSGPQHWDITPRRHEYPDPVHWTRALCANQGRQLAQAHSQFSGTTEGGGHLIWGPNYGTLCPTNPEPSPRAET